MPSERSRREKFQPVSDQMKAWSSALSAEFKDWPQVTRKSFFGFTALYRGKTIFGLLPRTKSVFRPNAVAFRFTSLSPEMRALLANDCRVAAFDKQKTRWFTFDLSSDRDLHDALDYLGRAFDAARTTKKRK